MENSLQKMLKNLIPYMRNPQPKSMNKVVMELCYNYFGLVKNKRFVPGKVGEKIIELYYEAEGVGFLSNPGKYPYIEDNRPKYLLPDGLLVDDNILVEVKSRLYGSTGTANEKIPQVPWKYNLACPNNKIVLFLLFADEHVWNREWVSLVKGEREPKNRFEELTYERDNLIIDNIIYGSTIANRLADHFGIE